MIFIEYQGALFIFGLRIIGLVWKEVRKGMQQNEGRDERLGSAPIGRLMLSMAVPAVAAQLINILYNIVDRIYIGHIEGYGAAALTGVGVTFPIIMLISA